MEEYNSTKKELEYYQNKGILLIATFWGIALTAIVLNNIYVFFIFIINGVLTAIYYGNKTDSLEEKLSRYELESYSFQGSFE
ncbi:unnamed protein product, partial [marine sediment metagenome]